MSNSETPIRDYMRQLQRQYKAKTAPVTLPTTMQGDKFVNIEQSELVEEGPQKGHWAKPSQKTNYKRIWIEGQNCYPRQQNPRTHEHINKTMVMNRNVKAVKLDTTGSLAESDSSAKNPIVTKYAKTYSKIKGDYWDYVAAMAIKQAKEKLAEKAILTGEYDKTI